MYNSVEVCTVSLLTVRDISPFLYIALDSVWEEVNLLFAGLVVILFLTLF